MRISRNRAYEALTMTTARCVRVAPRHKSSISQARVDLAVGERLAIRVEHDPSRRSQNRVARGGVPFHGRRETWIDIRAALRDDAEFERRAGGSALADR